MSINSIDHDEMSKIAGKWDFTEEVESQKRLRVPNLPKLVVVSKH